MNKLNTPAITFTAITAFLLLSGEKLFADDDQAVYPTIVSQPEDQAIGIGSNVTFAVTAVDADSYQWLRNGVTMDGKTNSTLSIDQVTVDDVALYTCYVAKETEEVPTRSAALNAVAVCDGGTAITIYGVPLFGSGGTSNGCPGLFAGYVSYVKTSGWGWVPTGALHTITDTNRPDTKVEYIGRYGDRGCNQTTVTIPNPTPNPKYRFMIYFPDNVPTNSYPIKLVGFQP
jgi:Immunoglobulin domain